MRRASSREAGEPAGRGPSATWRLTEAKRGGGVEAVSLGTRHGSRGARLGAVAVVHEGQVAGGGEGDEDAPQHELDDEQGHEGAHASHCGGRCGFLSPAPVGLRDRAVQGA